MLLSMVVPWSSAALVSLASLTAASFPLAGRQQGDSNTADACLFTDVESLERAGSDCSSIILRDINVPAGKTLNLTKLKEGAHVVFEGTTTFGYAVWKGPLISISGCNVRIEGAPGHVLDGGGARWWDTLGGNGGVVKPKFLFIRGLNDSEVVGLNFKNTPVHCVSIGRTTNLRLLNITIDNSDGDTVSQCIQPPRTLAHNTDGFDINGSTGILIAGANVTNQDDCLAINSGTNITFTDGYCSGGHGTSIGSVGGRENNEVRDVTISNTYIANSENGVRIKTVYDTEGSVSGVTFENITLDNITKYGIRIIQDYKNSGSTGTPTCGVPITDLTLSNVHGTVAKGGHNVQVLCCEDACSDWDWSDVDVTGGRTSSKCGGVPDEAFC